MPPFVTVSACVAVSPGNMFETAVRTAGLVLTSIVPVVKAHVELLLSVNCAREMEPAPIVRIETAPSRPTIPRLRVRRRAIWRSDSCISMKSIPSRW